MLPLWLSAIAALLTLRVQGAILYGIIAATVLAVIIEAIFKIGPQTPDGANPTGWSLTSPALPGTLISVPDFSLLGHFNLLGSFQAIGFTAVFLLVFTLMLADFFDTMGTMVAVGAAGDLLDEEGNPPRTRSILVVDSVGAIAGGAAGVSSQTSYIESASGVGEGARTGLASVVTGLLFLASMVFAPLVKVIPSEAAVPALTVVGGWIAERLHEKRGRAGTALVMGLAFKENVPDLRNSKVIDLVRRLSALGHDVTLVAFASPEEALAGTDLVVEVREHLRLEHRVDHGAVLWSVL